MGRGLAAEPFGADHHRMHGSPRTEYRVEHQPAGPPAAGWLHRSTRQTRTEAARLSGAAVAHPGPPFVPASALAAPQVSGHLLSPGTGREGDAWRPARPAPDP